MMPPPPGIGNILKKAAPHPAFALVIALAACLFFAPGIRADQTAEEAAAILTAGKWHFGNKDFKRTFKSDGTFTSNNGSMGNWKITGGELEIVFLDNTRHRFYLPIDPAGTRGIDNKGHPEMLVQDSAGPAPKPDNTGETPEPAAASAPTPPLSADVQQAASAIIQAHHDSLVFVTGTEGAGSGFIATIQGGNFLVTNVHVAAGIRDAAFKKLDGTVVQAGVPSMAVGEDIFCMAMPDGGKPLEIMQGVDTNAAVGDDVVVLGNAEGQGVVNTIIGKIVGIGPNLVEVDAPFVPGNSGSPIIHLKTGKVIGVATYTVTNEYDMTTNTKLKQPVIRRFGYRLDSVKGWQAVNWRSFDAQAEQMEKIETLTDDLYDFFKDLDENKMRVTLGRHNNPVIKTRIDDWLEAKGNHPSAEDAADADASFISFLKIACMSDIATAQYQITYDYFRRELGEQKGIRDQMKDAFQQIIQGLTQ